VTQFEAPRAPALGDAARPPESDAEGEVLGLAHVASCSFLASRIAPGGLQFWSALGGGMALARIASQRGPRVGYASSVAAIVQTVALIGPARVNGPLTTALNAPIMGHLQGKGASRAARLAAGLLIRYLHYLVVNVLYVVVIIGGLEEFTATYDRLTDGVAWVTGLVGIDAKLPQGTAWAIGLLLVTSIFYGLIWTTIQLLAYERSLQRWPAPGHSPVGAPGPPVRLGPRPAVVLALTIAAWAAVLISHDWLVLGAVGVATVLAILVTGTWRGRRSAWTLAAGLAAVLVVAALFPALIGAVDWGPAGQRAVRAILLVFTATWAREAMGTAATREVARRVLARLGFIPSLREAADLVGRLQSDERLAPAGKDLLERLNTVELQPAPVADALTDWIVDESHRYVPPDPRPA
jgi:hypothetical protein